MSTSIHIVKLKKLGNDMLKVLSSYKWCEGSLKLMLKSPSYKTAIFKFFMMPKSVSKISEEAPDGI